MLNGCTHMATVGRQRVNECTDELMQLKSGSFDVCNFTDAGVNEKDTVRLEIPVNDLFRMQVATTVHATKHYTQRGFVNNTRPQLVLYARHPKPSVSLTRAVSPLVGCCYRLHPLCVCELPEDGDQHKDVNNS